MTTTMTMKSVLGVTSLALLLATGACGGGAAVGLKHTISDKQLVDLPAEAAARVEQAKGVWLRAKDTYAAGDFEIRSAGAEVKAAGAQTESAADAVAAATDSIAATDDKMAGELDQAKARRDEQIAQARQRYNDDTAAIRARYEKQQAANRATLATAQRSKELAAAQRAVEQAELDEAKARGAVRQQEVFVAQAELELVKLEELQKVASVIGPPELEKKKTFEGQLAGERKKLVDLQAKLDARVKATEAARAKVEQVKARAGGAPKPE